ncbi:type II toxin-antitoxin system Phd/YefM family antitoxin [Desulfonatronum sp. SC1]|uniref:type II toxin-antitoxin system Phd/YefM family antitoxin n=1 Tax=Desulfonatronum sp. SC1 TaxID=2109626 RepID=UPI0011B23AF1|nr:hypothetical protein [Desulfonatronum sp. SC1]
MIGCFGSWVDFGSVRHTLGVKGALMLEVHIEDRDTQIFQLMQAALAGEHVLLFSSGKPLVRLTPISEPAQRTTGYHSLDISADELDAAFSSEVDEEVATLFNSHGGNAS